MFTRSRILWVVILTGALSLRVFGDQPSTQPIADKITQELQQAVVDGDVKTHREDIDKEYPKACAGAEDWATKYNAELATVPSAAGLNYRPLAIVRETQDPDMLRYLKFWSRVDISPTQKGIYPPNMFDDLGPVMENGRAFAILDSGKGGQVVLWFNPNTAHSRESFADLTGAARLGAAMAVVHDYLTAVRGAQDASACTTGPDVAWSWGKPTKWVFIEQQFQGGGIGFIPMKGRLDDLGNQTAQFGMWILEDGRNNLGIQVSLVGTTESKYLGWRIQKIEKVAAPKAEPLPPPKQ